MTLGKPLDLAGPELLIHSVKVTMPTSQDSGGCGREVMNNVVGSGGHLVLGWLSGW